MTGPTPLQQEVQTTQHLPNTRQQRVEYSNGTTTYPLTKHPAETSRQKQQLQGVFIKSNNIYLNGSLLVEDVPAVLDLSPSTRGQGDTNGHGEISGAFRGTADFYGNVKVSQEKDQFAFIYLRLRKTEANYSDQQVIENYLVTFSQDGRLLSKIHLEAPLYIADVAYLDHTRAYLDPSPDKSGSDGIGIGFSDFYVVENGHITKKLKNIGEGIYSPNGRFYAYNSSLIDDKTRTYRGVEDCGLGSTSMSEVRLLDFLDGKDTSIVIDLTKGFRPVLWSSTSSQLYIIEGQGPGDPACYAGDENFLVYTISTRTAQENSTKEEFLRKLKRLCSEGHIVKTGGEWATCDQIGVQ